MIGVIYRLTVRQMLGRGRTILMALLALVPVLIALVYRLRSQDTEQQEWASTVLLDGLVVTTLLLPLAALVYGTAMLGAEIEDGTASPVQADRAKPDHLRQAAGELDVASRRRSSRPGWWPAPSRSPASPRRRPPRLRKRPSSSAASFSPAFVMLSVVTSRALIAGLIYVFIWEGLVNGLFAGTAS